MKRTPAGGPDAPGKGVRYPCSARIAMLLLAAAVSGTSATVMVRPGDNLQDLINRNPPGTAFTLAPGVHRLESIEPRTGDSFLGERGAILSGARRLTSFERQGRYWVAAIQAVRTESKGECAPGSPACNLPEDVFIDNVPLHRSAALNDLSPGAWYLDYDAGKAYLTGDPQGHRVEISIARCAFSGTAGNVVIRGLTIEKYASPTGSGAIHAAAFTTRGKRSQGWVVEGNEIRWNHGVGVWLGNGMRIAGNKIHHNGHMGAGGSGRAVVVEGNEIAYNNYAGYDYHWGAGGAKFVLSEALEVRDNYVHHNEGPGLWSDIDNDRVLYERNRTSSNKVAGIFFEISFGAVIRNNTLENEGDHPGGSAFRSGAGILINTSSHADIYGNHLNNCANGILAVESNRGVSDWTGRRYVLKDLYVHDNTISQAAGTAAGVGSTPAAMFDVFKNWNNRFENNTYRLGDAAARHFQWMNASLTSAEWKESGNDRRGRFLSLN